MFAVGKGTIVAVITKSLDISFWKSVVIALTSGGIGAIGMITAALISARAMRRSEGQLRENSQALHDMKKAVGIDQRETDKYGQ